MHTYKHIYINICKSTYIYMWIHNGVYTHAYWGRYPYLDGVWYIIYVHIYTHIRVYVYTYIHIHTDIYMYIYICTPTHTHLHAYIHIRMSKCAYMCINTSRYIYRCLPGSSPAFRRSAQRNWYHRVEPRDRSGIFSFFFPTLVSAIGTSVDPAQISFFPTFFLDF